MQQDPDTKRGKGKYITALILVMTVIAIFITAIVKNMK
jgi:hypothetical protein